MRNQGKARNTRKNMKQEGVMTINNKSDEKKSVMLRGHQRNEVDKKGEDEERAVEDGKDVELGAREEKSTDKEGENR